MPVGKLETCTWKERTRRSKAELPQPPRQQRGDRPGTCALPAQVKAREKRRNSPLGLQPGVLSPDTTAGLDVEPVQVHMHFKKSELGVLQHFSDERTARAPGSTQESRVWLLSQAAGTGLSRTQPAGCNDEGRARQRPRAGGCFQGPKLPASCIARHTVSCTREASPEQVLDPRDWGGSLDTPRWLLAWPQRRPRHGPFGKGGGSGSRTRQQDASHEWVSLSCRPALALCPRLMQK